MRHSQKSPLTLFVPSLLSGAMNSWMWNLDPCSWFFQTFQYYCTGSPTQNTSISDVHELSWSQFPSFCGGIWYSRYHLVTAPECVNTHVAQFVWHGGWVINDPNSRRKFIWAWIFEKWKTLILAGATTEIWCSVHKDINIVSSGALRASTKD